MLNNLIQEVLGVYNFRDKNGKIGIRIYTCTHEDSDIQSIGDIQGVLNYCYNTGKRLDCYEHKGVVLKDALWLSDDLNSYNVVQLHRLRSRDKVNELLGVNRTSSQYYSKPYIYYNNKPMCMFVPNIEGSFKVENNMLIYNGEKKVFILPNDNYRHIDVVFTNKVFINLETEEVVGRYAGLNQKKQFVETEEYWDSCQSKWVVSKERITSIAGYKTVI